MFSMLFLAELPVQLIWLCCFCCFIYLAVVQHLFALFGYCNELQVPMQQMSAHKASITSDIDHVELPT